MAAYNYGQHKLNRQLFVIILLFFPFFYTFANLEYFYY